MVTGALVWEISRENGVAVGSGVFGWPVGGTLTPGLRSILMPQCSNREIAVREAVKLRYNSQWS